MAKNFKADPTSIDFIPIDPRLPVDYLEPIDPELSETIDLAEIKCIPRNAITTLIRCILPESENCLTARYWQSATTRLAALAHALHISPVGEHSLSILAPHLGVSRALLSFRTTAIRDFANLDCNAGRSIEARKKYKARASAVWARKAL